VQDGARLGVGYRAASSMQIAMAATIPAITKLAIRSFDSGASLGWCVRSARFKETKLLKVWGSVDGCCMRDIVLPLGLRMKEESHTFVTLLSECYPSTPDQEGLWEDDESKSVSTPDARSHQLPGRRHGGKAVEVLDIGMAAASHTCVIEERPNLCAAPARRA